MTEPTVVERTLTFTPILALRTESNPSNMPSPLRITMDGRSLCGKRTGVGTYTANLLENLLHSDPALEVFLVTDDPLPPFPWLDTPRLKIATRSLSTKNNFLWSNLVLRHQLKVHEAHLFHSPGYTMPLRPPRRTVVTIHDVSYAAHPEWYPYRLGILRKLWYRSSAIQADCVLTDSEFSQREIMRVYGIPEEKVCLVYCGVDRRRFRRIGDKQLLEGLVRRYELSEDFLLFVGDIHPRRNVGRIVEAFTSIKHSSRRFDSLELVLIGRVLGSSGASPEDELYSRNRGVRLLGYVDEEDLPLFYSLARALLFPSFYEGFGLPVLEAMACGCPVVVSRGTACDEIAGEAAVSVDPWDTKSIAEAAEDLLTHEDRARLQSELGFRRTEQFSWRRTAERTLAVYRRVAGLDYDEAARASRSVQFVA